MFKTFVGIDEFVDDGYSLCFFLGVKPPSTLPRQRKLFFPAVSDSVLQAVKDLSPKVLENGVSLVINPETYEAEKKLVDAVQRHLAYLYVKYVVFPSQSFTIPDNYNVRKEEGVGSILREWVMAKNLPLHLRFPLCDVLKELKLNLPVLILLPGPSLAEVGPYLKEMRKKCIIVCVARSLAYCMDHDCPPDFVVHLDTDIKMQHLFPREDVFPESFLVSLSPANISEVYDKFAGIFFKDSFNLSALKNEFRLRESWLSCSISCFGMAEVLNASKVFIAGGDHSWAGVAVDISTGTTEDKKNSRVDFVGPIKVFSRFPDQGISKGSGFDVFELPDVSGKRVKTAFNYFAIAEEINSIGKEFWDRGVECCRISPDGILNGDIFPVAGTEDVLSLVDIDRKALLSQLFAIDVQNNKIDFQQLEDLFFLTLQQVEQNSSFLSLKMNQVDYRHMVVRGITGSDATDKVLSETLNHPYVQSILQSSQSRKFQVMPRKWDIVASSVNVSKAWARALQKALAYLMFMNIIESRGYFRVLYNTDESCPHYDFFSRCTVETYRIVVDGIDRNESVSQGDVPYLAAFASINFAFYIVSDEIEKKFEYSLNFSNRYNYLTVSELNLIAPMLTNLA